MQTVGLSFASLAYLSLPLEILIKDPELLFGVSVFPIVSHVVIRDLLVVRAQFFKLFFSGLAPSLNPQKSLLFKVDAVLIFIASQSATMDVKVLVLVLSLVLALEALQVLDMLLFDPQFEIL